MSDAKAVGGEAERIAALLNSLAFQCDQVVVAAVSNAVIAVLRDSRAAMQSAASLLRSQALEIQKAQAQWREAESRVDDLQHLLARAQKAL